MIYQQAVSAHQVQHEQPRAMLIQCVSSWEAHQSTLPWSQPLLQQRWHARKQHVRKSDA